MSGMAGARSHCCTTLLRVRPEWHGPVQQRTLLSPSRRYQPLRARLSIDFVVQELRRMPGITIEGQARLSSGHAQKIIAQQCALSFDILDARNNQLR
jgi:hypothetical protein